MKPFRASEYINHCEDYLARSGVHAASKYRTTMMIKVRRVKTTEVVTDGEE